MQTIRSFIDQLLAVWNDSTPAARVGIGMLALILVGGIVGVGIWSAQPDYVVVNAKVDANDINSLISALGNENIPYKLNGRQLLVDDRKLDEARAILGEAGMSTSSSGYTPETLNALDSPTAQKDTQLLNLERKIKAQIENLKPVRVATVTVTKPRSRRFIRKGPPSTAAIVLDVDNQRFGEEEAQTVAQLVVKSVEGLDITNVTISDTLGNFYNLDRSYQNLSNQEKQRLERERALEFKVRDMLAPYVGFDNAIVKVSLEMSFTDQEKKQVIYDKDGKVLRREVINTSTNTGGRANPRGFAGTTANNQGVEAASIGTISGNTEDSEFDYEIPSTEIFERINQPVINSMGISVVVNETAVKEGTDLAALKTKLEGLVQPAVKFDATRDKMKLEFLPFETTEPAETVATPIPWDQIHQVLRNISLGLAGLVAFLLAFMTYRKWTPNQTTPSPALANKQSQVDRLREMVKEHPEIVEKIISAWSKSDSLTESTEPKSQAA